VFLISVVRFYRRRLFFRNRGSNVTLTWRFFGIGFAFACVTPLPVDAFGVGFAFACVASLLGDAFGIGFAFALVAPLPGDAFGIGFAFAFVAPLPVDAFGIAFTSASGADSDALARPVPPFLQLLVVFPLPLYIVFCDVSHHIAEVCVLPLGKCLRTQA
jgi:hypothetical protein